MIESIFVFFWTAFCITAAYFSWVKIVSHWKVYLMVFYNWLYLTGIFFFYPKFH